MKNNMPQSFFACSSSSSIISCSHFLLLLAMAPSPLLHRWKMPLFLGVVTLFTGAVALSSYTSPSFRALFWGNQNSATTEFFNNYENTSYQDSTNPTNDGNQDDYEGGGTCGNGVCDQGEDTSSCPGDCQNGNGGDSTSYTDYQDPEYTNDIDPSTASAQRRIRYSCLALNVPACGGGSCPPNSTCVTRASYCACQAGFSGNGASVGCGWSGGTCGGACPYADQNCQTTYFWPVRGCRCVPQ